MKAMKKILMVGASLALACGIGVAAVGCGGGFDPEGTINLYNREPGSGTRDAFLELIEVKEEDLATSTAFDSTGAVLTAVAGDPNGIGYISLGSVDDTVNALKIDGVEASAANVINNTYGISRPFEMMYQQEEYESNDLLRDFVTYLESADAQKVISDYGYVSVYSDADPYVAPTEDFETTTLNIGGSTSVQPLMSVDEEDVSCLIRSNTTVPARARGSQMRATARMTSVLLPKPFRRVILMTRSQPRWSFMNSAKTGSPLS